MKKNKKEITDYDKYDTSDMVDPQKALSFADIGIEIPNTPPTQVVSIRLPTELLNQLKAMGSQQDVPYQALIKLFLSEAIKKAKKKSA